MKKRCLTFVLSMAIFVTAACPALAAEFDPSEETELWSEEVSEEGTDLLPGDDSEDGVEADIVLQEDAEFTDETSNDAESAMAASSDINETMEYSEDVSLEEEDTEERIMTLSVTGVTLNKDKLTLNVIGQTEQLTAAVTSDGAADKSVIWSSSDESVVTVDASGKVTAVGAGTAVITAKTADGVYAAQCTVKVSFYNGLYQDPNGSGWYYYKDGMVDSGYTGFASNSNGKWYCENGKVTFQKQGILQDTTGALGSKSDWYYVIDSKVQTDFTGLSDFSNANGWWYITKGKVDFSKNTVAKNKNGWWYVLDGKVQFGFTGLADYSNENGWWYIQDGKVDFTKNTVAKNKNGWWYVLDGKVQFGFTGLADYSNANGWWYIQDGKVDFTVNTIAKNKNGWWYVRDGKVDFSAGDYSFAANTSQIIDVQASGSTGTLTLYNKNGNSFAVALSGNCYVGRNGITSDKTEGDGKTPVGVYTLGQAFGVASDPGSTRSYLKVNSNYYWVDDSTSKYYNQLVDISKVNKDWSSAEHLIDYSSAYKYAIAIDYNTACTPYKGSAIFLHCSTGNSTSGCVAVSESNMIKILQSLKGDTRIYIH